MSVDCYAEAIRRVLLSEGGYVNHPSDPGGPTNFGITLRDYRKFVKSNATAADVRAMKVEEAKAIYRGKYWNVRRGGTAVGSERRGLGRHHPYRRDGIGDCSGRLGLLALAAETSTRSAGVTPSEFTSIRRRSMDWTTVAAKVVSLGAPMLGSA